jgi:hypothetical protein
MVICGLNGLLIMNTRNDATLEPGYMKLEVWQRGMDLFDLTTWPSSPQSKQSVTETGKTPGPLIHESTHPPTSTP